jgi:hypothetical protein
LENTKLNHFIYISKYSDSGDLFSIPFTANGKYDTATDYVDALAASAFMPFVFSAKKSRDTVLHGNALDGYVGLLKNKVSGFSMVRKTATAANHDNLPITFLNFGHLSGYEGVIRHLKTNLLWNWFFAIMSFTQMTAKLAEFIGITWIRIAGIAGIPFFYSIRDFQWMFDAGFQDGKTLINPVLDKEYGARSNHESPFIPIIRNLNIENAPGGTVEINPLRIDEFHNDEYKMPIKKITNDLINISIYCFIVYCAWNIG